MYRLLLINAVESLKLYISQLFHGYELAITISYPLSVSGIIVLLKMPKRIAIFELPSCFCWRVSATKFVVNGICAHMPLPVKTQELQYTIAGF